MGYLWNPQMEERARTQERKAERIARRQAGVMQFQGLPATRVHNAATGQVSTMPARGPGMVHTTPHGRRSR